jgi:HAD superfamily hydrolase (TIGR01509 family)
VAAALHRGVAATAWAGRQAGRDDAMLRALIWDVDGTVAETELDGHRVAFNLAFEAAGLRWHWDMPTYGRLLEVTGGRERLLAFMSGRADAPGTASGRDALARELHRHKNALYAERLERHGIAARPGVRRLMAECEREGVALAVATTTSRSNVDALFASLFGAGWQARFAAVVCAEDAPAKKPDPQAYRLALRRLRLAPQEALAIEDSPNGLQAALAAGLRCGITRSQYFVDADFAGAAWVRDDLESPSPLGLRDLRDALVG